MNKRFLAECERERLHLSGHIQPHGALLVVDQAARITHRSCNFPAVLGDEILAPGDLLPPVLAAHCDTLPGQAGARLHVRHALSSAGLSFDLTISRNAAGERVLELTPAPDDDLDWQGLPAKVVGQPRDHDELAARKQALVERIAGITGFCRVMYYRFRQDGDGEVIAEARNPDVYGSYLGLRFPASDIPQIARELYRQSPWRLIPDASAAPVAVEGIDGVPDLGLADLRSVSPVHLVYLANMGVQASLSLPVMVAGHLHGLIACHHHQPRLLSLAVLEAAAGEVRTHGLVLTAFIAQNRIRLVDGLVRRFSGIEDIVTRAGGLLAAWDTLGPLLADELESEGVHLLLDAEQVAFGETFEPEALARVDEWFCDELADALWLSDTLSSELPGMPMSRIAGMVAIKGRTADGRMLRVYLTRQEHIHEVAWGGNPDKPVEHHDGQLGIAPRRSFEKWIEKRMGHSRPWENETRLLGLRLREMLLDVANRY